MWREVGDGWSALGNRETADSVVSGPPSIRQQARAMNAQPMLFDIPAPVEIGDALERCYTMRRLARACLDNVARYVPDPKLIIEPSVGGGAFVREIKRRWPLCEVWGCDLDPKAAGLALCDRAVVGDWSVIAAIFDDRLRCDLGNRQGGGNLYDRGRGRRVDAIVGNPPFSQAIEHIDIAFDSFDRLRCLSLILPLAYLGVGEWQPVWERRRLAEVHPIAGRPWPKRMRETAQYTWAAGFFGRTLRQPALKWRVRDQPLEAAP